MEEKPTIEDLREAFEAETQEPTSVQTTETEPVETTEDVSEDPLQAELERVRSKKSPAEKAKDSLYFNAKKAKELGIDPSKDEKLKEIFGITSSEPVDEDEKPVTRKEMLEILAKSQAERAVKTANELAESIQSEAERELVKYHLENTIRSTGNAEEDLRNARALANSARNQKIMEEVTRKPDAKNHSSATSGGTTPAEPEIVLTAEEKAFLATGVITKEEIIKARQGKL